MSKQIDPQTLKPAWLFLVLSMIYAIGLGIYSLALPKGSLLIRMAEKRTAFNNELFQWITRLGEEHIILFTILVFLFVSYRKSALISLTAVLSLVFAYISKTIFSQPRPLAYFTQEGIPESLGEISGYSFHSANTSMPSGHTLAAFSFFFVLALLFRKPHYQLTAFLLAAGVGLSRIYLGQHFGLDVSAGTLFGLAIGWVSYFLVYRVWADRSRLDGSLLRPKD
jgi:membrane-associated phospholipid phosphatase